jgi:hypothetical protein
MLYFLLYRLFQSTKLKKIALRQEFNLCFPKRLFYLLKFFFRLQWEIFMAFSASERLLRQFAFGSGAAKAVHHCFEFVRKVGFQSLSELCSVVNFRLQKIYKTLVPALITLFLICLLYQIPLSDMLNKFREIHDFCSFNFLQNK